MRENVLNKIIVCKFCKTSYMPENGEICKCEEPADLEWDKEQQPQGKSDERLPNRK